MLDRKKVGLALSGGGVKGLAHIGVLRVLEEYNIPIDMISGTSIGAIIGSLYSFEPNAKKLEKEILKEDIGSFLDYTVSRYGLIKGKKIEQYLEKRLGEVSFNELKIPLFITAFDIEKKREVIFSKGNVAKAVRASISLPGVFIPVENNKEILIDAGMVDPVPTDILRKEGADIIIAVNVNSIKEKKPFMHDKAIKSTNNKKLPSMYETAVLAIEIQGSQVSKADVERGKPDFIININLEGVGLFEYKKAKNVIKKGRTIAKKSLLKLKDLTGDNSLKNLIDELKINLGVKKIVKNIKKIR